MIILKNLFLFKKNTQNNKNFNEEVVHHYKEIADLVKEARIQKKTNNSRIVLHFKDS